MVNALKSETLAEGVKECSACGACLASCPTNSIAMKEDKEGFHRPYISSDSCIGCRKCLKICPALNLDKEIIPEIPVPQTYAVVHKDADVLSKSSSGGAFSAIAKDILDDGGVVCGAIYDEHLNIIHSISDTMEGIAPMRGSKYAPGAAYPVFKEIKKVLKTGRKVLFTGLPCQVVGLKAYLGNLSKNDNLVTCDIICHGMVSHALYKGFLSSLSKNNKHVKSINFRQKTSHGSVLRITYTNQTFTDIPFNKNHYYHILLSDNCLRHSCYNCIARQLPRKADLTIGDFWGVKKILPDINEKKGVSVIFTHSIKANEIVKRIATSTSLIKTPFSHSVYENSAFWISPTCYPSREKFISYLRKHGYQKTVKHFYKRSPLKRCIYTLGRHVISIYRNIFPNKRTLNPS